MNNRIASATLAAVIALASGYCLAKIPPPPPPDEKAKAAAEEKKAKDKAAAEKAKADQTAAEDRAVSNYHQNLKKQGKPIPKAVPIVAQSTPPTGGKPAPEANTVKAAEKAKAEEAAKAKAGGKK